VADYGQPDGEGRFKVSSPAEFDGGWSSFARRPPLSTSELKKLVRSASGFCNCSLVIAACWSICHTQDGNVMIQALSRKYTQLQSKQKDQTVRKITEIQLSQNNPHIITTLAMQSPEYNRKTNKQFHKNQASKYR